jgi:hypothetical protein
MPVDQQQNARVVITALQKSADSHVRIAAVVGGVEAGYTAQQVGDRAPSVSRNLIGGDDRDSSRRLPRIFKVS